MMRLVPRLLLVLALLALGLAACDGAEPLPDDPFAGTWTLDRVRVQPEGGDWVDITALVRLQVETSTLVFDGGAFTVTIVSTEGATATRTGTYTVDTETEVVTFSGEDFDEPAELAFATGDGGDRLTLAADDLNVLATLAGIDIETLLESLQDEDITFERTEVRLQREA